MISLPAGIINKMPEFITLPVKYILHFLLKLLTCENIFLIADDGILSLMSYCNLVGKSAILKYIKM